MGGVITKNNQILLLVIVFCSICFSSSLVTNNCRTKEKTALLQFMSHFSFNESYSCDYSHTSLPWNKDDDCCDWDGVECDDGTGHVIGLDLVESCLTGTIPLNSSLFNLLHLETINLSGNNINDSRVSPLFGNLKNLTSFNMSDCFLSGLLPNEIFELHKLETLDLGSNKKLTGKLPESIGELELLEKLFFGGCRLDGFIPTSIGKLKKLRTLDISKNNFSGHVLASLSNLQDLTFLDLSYNNLQGPILRSITDLKWCYHLDLSVNQFTDTIDLNIFTIFSSLEYLDLSNSGASLTTSNLDFLSALRSINNLRLSSCDLKINILANLRALNQLLYVDLSNNEIGGALHPSICKLGFIYYLDLSSNHLNGQIPSCLGNSTGLSMLNLQSNNFHGTIPQSFGYSKSMKLLDLSDNLLQGNIPRSLVFSMQLEVLNLGCNMLSDGFPFWLGNISSLKVVILRENELNGTLKQSQFANLHIIDMSRNDFTGNIPTHFFDNFDAMMIVHDNDTSLYSTVQTEYTQTLPCLSIPKCRVSEDSAKTYSRRFYDYYALNIMNKGSFLPYERVLAAIKVVDFPYNKLNGNVPSSIGKLKGIKVLNLSRNSLEGPIPWFLENLTNLESLDLSANMLSGEIPGNLLWSNLNSLGFLDFSQNNLTGRIPALLDKFPKASYEKNPGLCGLPLSRLCSKQDKPVLTPPNIPIEKKHRFTFDVNGFGWEIVLIGYGCGMVFGLKIGSCISIRKEGWVRRVFNL